MLLYFQACKMCWNSDSVVGLVLRWNQSPGNWRNRPRAFGTNPRERWGKQRSHGDVTIRIMSDAPVGLVKKKESYPLNT